MNETTKKALVIGAVVVAVAIAAYSGMKTLGDPPVEQGVNNSLPAGSKTGKQMEMESMQRGAPAGGDRSESLGGPDGS